jgi:hypothetical protein
MPSLGLGRGAANGGHGWVNRSSSSTSLTPESAKPGSPTVRKAAELTSQGYCPSQSSRYNRLPFQARPGHYEGRGRIPRPYESRAGKVLALSACNAVS